ncbi:MAG: VirB3 family type IV secretion system protein [Rickettsiales bacterium]
MAGETGQVHIDPLFVGLTRPPMFLGVSFMFAILNGFVSLIAYINDPSLKVIFIAVLMHLCAYIICFKEPLFLELYLKKGQKTSHCKNKVYHGANSYDPY